MISDNFVTGDNIYLSEMYNFFFEVLGMMSITHYGAVGDGITDNYGYLQVAIDDAHRRGLSFLYVPYGRYIYTGELLRIDDIIFMGNPHAHIVNIRTGTEIKIHQFGWYTSSTTSEIHRGEYIDLSGEVGDVVDLTPVVGENTAYFMTNVSAGDRYDIVGDYTYVRLDPDTNEIAYKHSGVASDYANRDYYDALSDGIFVISFQNTDTVSPQIYKVNNYVIRSGDTMTGPLAIGGSSTASGTYSFAQGEATASGNYSHAEGYQTTASNLTAHAEGFKTTASGNTSHAEGDQCVASGVTSHAENSHTTASGHRSHAEGWKTVSSNNNTHSEGYGTIAQGRSQHTEGELNIADTGTTEGSENRGTYIHIAGNGTFVDEETQNRSNAYTLDWSGNAWFAGNVFVGSTSGTNKDAGSKKLATEEYVNSHTGTGNVVCGTYTGSSSETTITAQGITEIKYAMIASSDEKLTATIIPNGDAIISRGENVTGVTEKVMAYHLSSVTISGNTITIGSTNMLNEDQSEYYYMIVG